MILPLGIITDTLKWPAKVQILFIHFTREEKYLIIIQA